jgi:cystathionine gamma-lyase
MSDKPRHFATRTIHAGEQFEVADNAIFPAIVTASSFIKRGLDDTPDYSYSRVGNPTRHAYETCVAALEEGVGAVACASGVNATATVLELLPKDAHVVVMNGVYGGTFRIMEDYRSRTSGLTTTYVDLNDLEAVAAAIKPETRLIWIESPTNPLLHLVDIKAVCDLARTRGILTCIDNTFCSPWNQRPITLGVDLVMHSASKYIGGHSDLTGGVVVAASEDLHRQLRRISMAIGAVQGPFDCYLALRGLKTLDVRMERQCANALEVARRLEGHPQVEQVYYPGLQSHPQHAPDAQRRGRGRHQGQGRSGSAKPSGRSAADFRTGRFAGRGRKHDQPFLDHVPLLHEPRAERGDGHQRKPVAPVSGHRGGCRPDR